MTKDRVTIETAIRWHRESLSDLESILEEDVPVSIYGYKDEAAVEAEITRIENAITELKNQLQEEVTHGKS